MAFHRGWRYVAFISGFVGVLGLTLYPIAISPMIDASEYRIVYKPYNSYFLQEKFKGGKEKYQTGGHTTWKYEGLDRPIWTEEARTR
ncbi:unnamed protein product [Arctia plantaginis]|uniref:Uncharacterized protein n=1 Tax=Arctia plantaginis TaxID=874455 RepID=A0A8S1B0P9_ARCPL|nr:unnamed protein product [Arctia plantaginis]